MDRNLSVFKKPAALQTPLRQLCTLIAVLCLAPPIHAQTEWLEVNLSQFKIYHTPQDKKNAADLATLLTTSLENLSAKTGLQLAKPVMVYLCSSNNAFEELTGNVIPHWGAGIAESSRGRIVLKSPSLTEDYTGFPKLVRHELVHILIGQAIVSRERPPRWFSEGIAILLSNDEEFEGGRAISKALMSDSIIPLDEIDNVLKFHQAKARLAYEESYSFILFLEEKHGVDGLLKLVRSLDKNTSFERAFTKIFSTDLFDLEIEWYDFLGKKYRWRFLLDFETFLWIFILFLFIFVFIGIRFRNRKIIKKWDKEESLTDPNW